jgi:hypothetical protein
MDAPMFLDVVAAVDPNSSSIIYRRLRVLLQTEK